MTKEEQLNSLYKQYNKEFEKEEVVLGEGNLDTEILLVGEAPGKDEVRLGKPFVGVAGKNLSEFLDMLNIPRNIIYITNSIKYRLFKINPKTGKKVNRPAKKSEIENNRKYLMQEISIIKPKYVVTLGNVPLRAVVNDFNISIGNVHGNMKQINANDIELNLYPLYHPASIIYNKSLRTVYIQDIKRLKSYLYK